MGEWRPKLGRCFSLRRTHRQPTRRTFTVFCCTDQSRRRLLRRHVVSRRALAFIARLWERNCVPRHWNYRSRKWFVSHHVRNSRLFRIQGIRSRWQSRSVGRGSHEYKLVVTFNGISFDVPWLRRELGPLRENAAHVDLMHVLRTVGLRGGLKKIQKTVGLDRGDDLSQLTGRDAVNLWNMAQNGEPNALKRLFATTPKTLLHSLV